MLLPLLHKHGEWYVVLIIELNLLIHSKIPQPFSVSIPPRFLAFVRLISVHWSGLTLSVTIKVLFLLKPIIKTLASLNL